MCRREYLPLDRRHSLVGLRAFKISLHSFRIFGSNTGFIGTSLCAVGLFCCNRKLSKLLFSSSSMSPQSITIRRSSFCVMSASAFFAFLFMLRLVYFYSFISNISKAPLQVHYTTQRRSRLQH